MVVGGGGVFVADLWQWLRVMMDFVCWWFVGLSWWRGVLHCSSVAMALGGEGAVVGGYNRFSPDIWDIPSLCDIICCIFKTKNNPRSVTPVRF